LIRVLTSKSNININNFKILRKNNILTTKGNAILSDAINSKILIRKIINRLAIVTKSTVNKTGTVTEQICTKEETIKTGISIETVSEAKKKFSAYI
jgi:hypothetical protein